MNFQGAPEELTDAGTVEKFERIDPNSKEGRALSRRNLLKSQPNSLRAFAMDIPALNGQPTPKIEYLVDRIIPEKTFGMVVAPGGTGKTSMLMHAGICVSRGAPWLGMATKKHKVLCLLTEDPEEVCHIRCAHIAKAMGVSLADLPDFIPVPVVRKDVALVRFDRFKSGEYELTHVYDELVALCDEYEATVLILDALHGLFDGNENDRGQARTFCALLSELAANLGGAVIMLAHPSKSSEDKKNPASGSTSWQGGVRWILQITQDDEMNHDARTLKLMKGNYSGKAEDIHVTWRDGVFQQDAEPQGVFKHIAGSRAERVMIEGLRKAIDKGFQPSPHQSARDKYAPALVIAMGNSEGLKVPDLARVMSRLIQDGELVLITIGPQSREKQVVCPKDMRARFEGPSKPSNPSEEGAK